MQSFHWVVSVVTAVSCCSSFSTARQPQSKGESIKLALKDGQAAVTGSLSKDDPKDKVYKHAPCKVYGLELKAGQAYQIDMSSKTIDATLRLENLDGKMLAQNDDAVGDSV